MKKQKKLKRIFKPGELQAAGTKAWRKVFAQPIKSIPKKKQAK
jgi:hypothetical protein